MSQAKITEWLETQAEKHEGGVVKLFYLTELRQGHYSAQLDEWPLSKSTVREVAQAAWKVAQDDFEIFDGAPRYELLLFVDKGGKAEQKARHGFNADPKKKESDQLSPMGDATVSFMRQVFSHNEVLVKTLVQVVTAGEASKLREIERLTQRSDGLERRLQAMHDEIEKSKDKNHDRALEKAKFEGDERRLDELLTTGRTLAPFMVNAIAKQNLLPTGDSSLLLETMKPVMDSLTPDQFSQLQAIFTPAQLVAFNEVYKLAKGEEKNAKRRDKKDETHR